MKYTYKLWNKTWKASKDASKYTSTLCLTYVLFRVKWEWGHNRTPNEHYGDPVQMCRFLGDYSELCSCQLGFYQAGHWGEDTIYAVLVVVRVAKSVRVYVFFNLFAHTTSGIGLSLLRWMTGVQLSKYLHQFSQVQQNPFYIEFSWDCRLEKRIPRYMVFVEPDRKPIRMSSKEVWWNIATRAISANARLVPGGSWWAFF